MEYFKKFTSFFIILILFDICETYVIINLKKLEKNSDKNVEYTPEVFIEHLYNKYYGLLNVGYPPQKTEVQFSLDYYGLSFQEDVCLTSNFYDKNKSVTLSQTTNYAEYSYLKNIIVVYETIEFPVYNSTSKQTNYKTIPNYKLIYNKTIANESKSEEILDKNISSKTCLIYSFKLSCPRNEYICISTPPFLRQNGLTKSDNFNFIYYTQKEKSTNGGYDAAILIGENPHEYNSEKYNEKTYLKTNALQMILELGWIFEFKNYAFLNNGTKVEFGITSLDKKVKGWLLFDLDIIIGVKDYLNFIKTNYFDNYFDIKNFPTIFFHSLDFGYKFELTYKDHFEIRGDKKYFLIVFDKVSNYPWKFGRLFMQKYFFNFETDSRQIGFYNNNITLNNGGNEEKNKYKIYFWVLFGVIIIILGVGGYFIVNLIRKRNRKKRANELVDDDFEYKEDMNNNKNEGILKEDDKNNNDNLLIN